MFDMFPEQWTPVTFSRRVPRERPIRGRVAGEDVVLFRDRAGRVAALIDRCPHRGVALSLGRVTPEGALECPFHGWRFAADGSCTRVPFCTDAKRERLGAIALPVRERGGLVFLYTGVDARGSEPELPEALVEPGWSHFEHAEEWSTHWTRAMENMLDYPHLPYVHRRSIGRGLRAPAERGAPLTLKVVPSPWGMEIVAHLDGRPAGAGLEWRRPNGMVLDLSFGRRRMRQHVYCVPVDARTTRMMLVTTRDFGLSWLLRPVFWAIDWSNTWILREDRAVVESSQPPEVPPAADEKSVASDGPTLAFRRWYLKERERPMHATVPPSALRRARAASRQPAPLDEAS